MLMEDLPNKIRVYDDRLCIWDPGVLPEKWTARKLFTQHASCPYNPLIANAFFRAGEIEAWGRGIQRIVDACKEANTPKPNATYTPCDLWFDFPFSKEYLQILSSPESSVGQPATSTSKSKGKNPDRLVQILERKSDHTIPELALALELSVAGVEKIMRSLKKDGRLHRIGPDKGGRWEVLP